MELGAIVCVPTGPPTCGACPWSGVCRAHLAGREAEFPVRSEKKARRIEMLDVFVLRHADLYAVRKRGEGLLAGLWEFPNSPSQLAPSGENQQLAPSEGNQQLAPSEEGGRGVGATFGEVLATKSAKHIFTHVEWRMTGYLIEAKERDPQFAWVSAGELRAHYAIPSAFRAFLAWLEE